MPAERVVVVGTGTMGAGIAEVFALHGARTVLCGRTPGSVASGLDRARRAGANLEAAGRVEAGRTKAAGERLSGSTDIEGAVADADFVVECVPENLAVKQAVFERLGRAAPGRAVLVTNTSGLSITDIASAAAHPDRVAGMHWWNPPHLVPLVEVVSGERTNDATVEEVLAVARALGKRPVRVRKDVPGFIANRLQYALLREAADLVERGVATPEDVDRAMRCGPGLRYAALGPFEAADFIGLDVVAEVMRYLLPDLGGRPDVPEAVEKHVRAGRLGVKAGAGFYDYTDQPREEVLAERDEKLARLLAAGFGW